MVTSTAPTASNPSGASAVAAVGRMVARARVRVERVGGADRVVECRGEPPLLPRRTADGVYFVASAAGPLAGDQLTTELSVGAGAHLFVGSVGATYARPGIAGCESVARVEVDVGAGGRLTWAPEPVVAVAGCRHRSEAVIALGPGAELFWVDVVVLGRHDEVGGDVWARRSVDLVGSPLNRQDVAMTVAGRAGPDPVVLGGARVVASFLAVHPEWAGDAGSRADWRVTTGPVRAGVLPLAGPAAEVVALAADVHGVHVAFGALAGALAASHPATSAALAAYATSGRR